MKEKIKYFVENLISTLIGIAVIPGVIVMFIGMMCVFPIMVIHYLIFGWESVDYILYRTRSRYCNTKETNVK